MATTYEKIESVEQLRKACNDESMEEFFIVLGSGIRSSKEIMLSPDGTEFYINNNIDDTEQNLTASQIMDEGYTNIGKAMQNGRFYKVNFN